MKKILLLVLVLFLAGCWEENIGPLNHFVGNDPPEPPKPPGRVP